MRLIVEAKDPVAAGTVRLRLADPGGADLPTFEPGAHVALTIAGLERRYSLVSAPDDPSGYEICVLRTQPSRGGSTHIHDQLAVGDAVDVSAPRNTFLLARDAARTVFVAGGIGITPFLTMMAALSDAGRPFELHYAARDAGRFLPLPPDLPMRRYADENGRRSLDVDALLDGLERDAHLYVCGPRLLIEAVRLSAADRGWPASHVHIESFGAAARPGDRQITVRLAMSGGEVVVPPETTILDALLQAGIWAPYECRRGECSSCHVEVLSGEPDHRDVCLTPAQRDAGLCTCISRADGGEIELNL